MHESYIRRCFHLANLAGKEVRPNPRVGAILVHNNRIIAEGFHKEFGGPHAEVECINAVKKEDRPLIRNSTLYVSLEPCSIIGKTPACTNLIIKERIPKVVISTRDPNPLVDGTGIELLKNAGVEVIQGVLDSEGKELIRVFKTNQLLERPYVILKTVKSRDNYIGKTGKRIWLSNEFSSILSHKWRSQVDGIMVGTNTVMNDDPRLNNRLYPGSSPVKITIDREGKLDKTHKIFAGREKTILFTSNKTKISIPNVEVIGIDFDDVDFIPQLLKELFIRNIYVLMIEGGAKLIRSFIKRDLWDEARIITCPAVLSDGIKAPNIKGRLAHKEMLEADELQIIYNK